MSHVLQIADHRWSSFDRFVIFAREIILACLRLAAQQCCAESALAHICTIQSLALWQSDAADCLVVARRTDSGTSVRVLQASELTFLPSCTQACSAQLSLDVSRSEHTMNATICSNAIGCLWTSLAALLTQCGSRS